MNTEIELLFMKQYLPITDKKQRILGQDFLAVAFHIMDELRDPGKTNEYLQNAALTMVNAFNKMLTIKMPSDSVENMVQGLVEGRWMIRSVAISAYEQLKNDGYIS